MVQIWWACARIDRRHLKVMSSRPLGPRRPIGSASLAAPVPSDSGFRTAVPNGYLHKNPCHRRAPGSLFSESCPEQEINRTCPARGEPRLSASGLLGSLEISQTMTGSGQSRFAATRPWSPFTEPESQAGRGGFRARIRVQGSLLALTFARCWRSTELKSPQAMRTVPQQITCRCPSARV